MSTVRLKIGPRSIDTMTRMYGFKFQPMTSVIGYVMLWDVLHMDPHWPICFFVFSIKPRDSVKNWEPYPTQTHVYHKDILKHHLCRWGSAFCVISSLLAMTQVAFGVAVSHSRQGMLDHLGTGWAKRRAGSENSNSGNHSARQDSDETVSNCHSFLENRRGYTHAFILDPTDPTSLVVASPRHLGTPHLPLLRIPRHGIPYRLLEAWKAHRHIYRCHVMGSLSLFFPCKQHFSGRVWTTMRLTKMWCLTLLPQQTGFVQR